MTVERISVVLPVYNERDNIATCLTGLDRALQGVEHEILVCYDFDEDTTLAGIRAMGEAAPRALRLVKNTLGRGPHNALKAGFAAASGDVVVTTMADLSDPPELIPRLAEKVRAGADVVAGSRYMPGGSQSGGPLLKRTLSRIAGVSLAWVAGLGTSDATSNFRAYSKRFLERTRIDATAGFEIALELTVKAHLAGSRVDEVPSSWTDRTAGESRFRLWKWLPNYLRWYLLALWEPAAVWLALLVGLALPLATWTGHDQEAARLLAWGSAAGAAAALLATRAVRGRTRWFDAGQVLIWFAPPFGNVPAGIMAAIVGARLLASAVFVAASAGALATWNALRRLAGRCDQRAFGIALLAVALTLTRVEFMKRMAGLELDPSWQQSLGRALVEGRRFGVEVQFTYGPLGYFMESPFVAGLYWTKTVLFELVLRLICAGFVALAIARVPGVLERILCALAALMMLGGHDAWAFLVVASVGAWYFARPERGVLHESLGTAVLVVLSLVKFTWFLYAGVVWVLFGAWCWRTRGIHRGLRTPALAAGLLLVLWCGIGQQALDLPRYLWSSWQIASGYPAAMGYGGDLNQLSAALAILGLVGLVALVNLWRRPFCTRALALSLVLVAGAFLAFKAGYVRSFGNSVTYLAFVAAAPFLLTASGAATALDRWRGRLLLGLRLALIALIVPAFAEARMASGRWVQLYFHEAPNTLDWKLRTLLDLGEQRRTIEEESQAIRNQSALPRISETVGRASVDLLGFSQGTLHANGLNWTPRPAFQSYIAYTPGLLRANAEFLAGPSAPWYLLHEFGTIDNHLPNMEDTLALQVMSRDYVLLREEGPYLLLQHTPRPAAERPELQARQVQLDAEFPFGEWIDIGHTPGGAHLLQLEFDRTLRGALMNTLLRPPALHMQVEDSEQRADRFRIVPSMMEAGVFVHPFAVGNADWLEWFTSGNVARVTRVRITLNAGELERGGYEPRVRVRLIRADDLVPARTGSVDRTSRFPMFVTQPHEINARFPWFTDGVGDLPVLVVHAPSELAYGVGAGRHRVRARYGLLPAAWKAGEQGSDGVFFSVVSIAPDGKETVHLRRYVDPRAVQADRAALELDLTLELATPGPIVLRTRPGPRADTNSDFAWWSKIEVTPLGPEQPPR